MQEYKVLKKFEGYKKNDVFNITEDIDQDIIDGLVTDGLIAVVEGNKDSVTVTWGNGSRTYSKEIHGDDFEDLAKQMADQHSDAVIA
jgi:hypothetical protein